MAITDIYTLIDLSTGDNRIIFRTPDGTKYFEITIDNSGVIAMVDVTTEVTS